MAGPHSGASATPCQTREATVWSTRLSSPTSFSQATDRSSRSVWDTRSLANVPLPLRTPRAPHAASQRSCAVARRRSSQVTGEGIAEGAAKAEACSGGPSSGGVSSCNTTPGGATSGGGGSLATR